MTDEPTIPVPMTVLTQVRAALMACDCDRLGYVRKYAALSAIEAALAAAARPAEAEFVEVGRAVGGNRRWRVRGVGVTNTCPTCGVVSGVVSRPAEPERTVRDVLRWGAIDGEYLADLGADLAAGLRVGPEVAARIGRIASRLLEADALLWPDGSGVVGADTMPLDEYHRRQAERDEVERRRAESDT